MVTPPVAFPTTRPHAAPEQRARLRAALVAFLVLAAAIPAIADDDAKDAGSAVDHDGMSTPSKKFRLRFELKAHVRDSDFVQFKPKFPFPEEFILPGDDAVYMRTPDEGTSAEISNVEIRGDGEISPHFSGRINVHILDLYNRNPTSSDDLVSLREAWLRVGKKQEELERIPGTTFHAQIGKSPRFTKQLDRHLESYGLWGTAVGRFEEIGLELGGSFGEYVYWRGSLMNGNPLFFRDPNALAGDNGTPERLPPDPTTTFETGFPIMYDAKAQDVGLDGELQTGAGLGFRWRSEGDADKDVRFDALVWYFQRKLEDEAKIRGTFYQGDLELLRGAGIPLPFRGDDKKEMGANLRFELGPGASDDYLGKLHFYGQYVSQEIAELERSGFEAEIAYRIPLNGVFVSGDEPVLNWIEPVVRYSLIDNEFKMPSDFVAPSMGWDWRKLDVGVRLGVVRGIDVTLEYARHDMITAKATLHPDEALLTVRTAF